MVEFVGRMLDGRTFFCKMKDVGLNSKRHWYSSRFTLRVRRQLPFTFYSRVDSDICDVSSNACETRLSEDYAMLESKGVDTSTIKIIS